MIASDFERQAAEAETESATGQTPNGFSLMKFRDSLPTLALCTLDGRALEMWSAATHGDQVCGKVRHPSGDVEQMCLGVDELASVGVPYVVHVFGYFPGTSDPVTCP